MSLPVVLCVALSLSSSSYACRLFEAINTDDLDIAAIGSPAGHLDIARCGSTCYASANCRAYARSADGRCFLLAHRSRSWSERPTGLVTLMLPKAVHSPNCTVDRFPIARGRSRYRFGRAAVDWLQAASHCEGLGSKLVQISTEQERLFIWKVAQATAGVRPNLLVGLQRNRSTTFDENKEGWMWHLSEDSFDRGAFWDKNEPSNKLGVEFYSLMKMQNGLFNDVATPNIVMRYFCCECFIF